MDAFRSAIDDCSISDLGCRGSLFTWQRGSLMERLDRFLACAEWLRLFPNYDVSHFARYNSDHSLISLNTEPTYCRDRVRRRPFRFESLWLDYAECAEIVSDQWHSTAGLPNEKLKSCADGLASWASVKFKHRSKRIKELEQTLKELHQGVPDGFTLERAKMVVAELQKDEESYWHLRARANELRDGDKNTSYFHQRACKWKSRNRIRGLFNAEGEWQTTSPQMEKIVVDYYTGLFSSLGSTNIEESLHSVEACVSPYANDALLVPPTAVEIKDAQFQMHPTKAPGVDGMHALFYQKFWGVVGADVVSYIQQWWNGQVTLEDINHTVVALIPKIYEPKYIAEFRPISLCNVLYKIISKFMLCYPDTDTDTSTRIRI